MDDAARTNRRAWEEASSKYVRECAETLAIAPLRWFGGILYRMDTS